MIIRQQIIKQDKLLNLKQHEPTAQVYSSNNNNWHFLTILFQRSLTTLVF